jgi:hypothetical protein
MMSLVTLPNWTANGVLPPNNSMSPTSSDRSPYRVCLSDFILRFSTSTKRNKILDGYLRFRSDLHALGLNDGFQWVNGSFLEDIERTASRDPNDIDVVTFFRSEQTQEALLRKNPALFNQPKTAYLVDSYLFELSKATPERIVANSAYWYSVWSHNRSGEWKGYVEIDLKPQEDQAARNILEHALERGDEP